jgi:glycosyltransferase involved in cell wall biosynthesis
MPRFSIVIPARNEEKFLPACLDAIDVASQPFPGQVETIVAVNRCTDRTEEIALSRGARIVHEDARNLSKIRNAAAQAATGDVLITVDADSRMTPTMLEEVDRMLQSGRYIGGGVMVWPERYSVGILATGLMLLPVVLRHGVSGGLFWCLRADFDAVGGFDESCVSVEDLDFAKRLKAYGKKRGKRFGTIYRASIITSCRKMDMFGDWYLVLNPRLVWRLFTTKSQSAADHFYYDIPR